MVNLAHLIQRASSLPSDTSALERAISALEREITALESSSVPWERRLPWFTAVVALGVAKALPESVLAQASAHCWRGHEASVQERLTDYPEAQGTSPKRMS